MREPAPRKSGADRDRFPSDAELLHELRKHGAKPPPREPPGVSRRTRDYLLVTAGGCAVIGVVAFRLLGNAEIATVKMALTAMAVFCGLTWYVFYGVMSRY